MSEVRLRVLNVTWNGCWTILNAAEIVFFYFFFRRGSVNKKMPRWSWGWEMSVQSARGVAPMRSGCSYFQLKRNLEREKDRDAAVRLKDTADALLHPKWSDTSKHKIFVWFWTSVVFLIITDKIYVLVGSTNICIWLTFTKTEYVVLL